MQCVSGSHGSRESWCYILERWNIPRGCWKSTTKQIIWKTSSKVKWIVFNKCKKPLHLKISWQIKHIIPKENRVTNKTIPKSILNFEVCEHFFSNLFWQPVPRLQACAVPGMSSTSTTHLWKQHSQVGCLGSQTGCNFGLQEKTLLLLHTTCGNRCTESLNLWEDREWYGHLSEWLIITLEQAII